MSDAKPIMLRRYSTPNCPSGRFSAHSAALLQEALVDAALAKTAEKRRFATESIDVALRLLKPAKPGLAAVRVDVWEHTDSVPVITVRPLAESTN
jgi:hypothetical protein